MVSILSMILAKFYQPFTNTRSHEAVLLLKILTYVCVVFMLWWTHICVVCTRDDAHMAFIQVMLMPPLASYSCILCNVCKSMQISINATSVTIYMHSQRLYIVLTNMYFNLFSLYIYNLHTLKYFFQYKILRKYPVLIQVPQGYPSCLLTIVCHVNMTH